MLRHATCLHPTSSNEQSKCMTSSYYRGELITSWRERAYRKPYRQVSYVKQRINVNFMLCHATCLHPTSSNEQCLVPGMITSLHSKCMTSSYHGGELITSWRERAYRKPYRQVLYVKQRINDNQLAGNSLSHMQTLGYRSK